MECLICSGRDRVMAKEWAQKFYKGKAWRECRKAYIAGVYGLCETCRKNGLVNPGKILHHTIYLTPMNINDPNVSLNHALLRFDCQECHNKEHMRVDDAVREGLAFDNEGNLIRISPP